MVDRWTGSAAVCINQNNLVLMVLQGKPEEEKKWSVPSGGKLPRESYEECCKREVYEETGFIVEIKQKIYVKNDTVHYFMVEVVGGGMNIQDPDKLIYEVAWKSIDEIQNLKLSFDEDRELLVDILSKNQIRKG